METHEISRRLLGHNLPGRFPNISESGCWAILHHHTSNPDGFTVSGLGHVRVVDHSATSDKDASPGMHLVVHIEFDDGATGYYRINGYWDSWDAVWDGVLFPVMPKTETITRYQPVQRLDQQ
ncbi:hypothetical protein IU485_27735 [Nocardia cyriacigeorgica]|uniref:hypothetical protein n=1 Tax=Nocardia cyriacigeorgica TaxID=135487 RepID=UPI001893D508|nr:hypothetical protein [Nocardia cyriacigeorgica]MBF6085169.1 hypothetical protein [Nocardia cyriacigeorgica]